MCYMYVLCIHICMYVYIYIYMHTYYWGEGRELPLLSVGVRCYISCVVNTVAAVMYNKHWRERGHIPFC